jgi:hypothetical protein
MVVQVSQVELFLLKNGMGHVGLQEQYLQNQVLVLEPHVKLELPAQAFSQGLTLQQLPLHHQMMWKNIMQRQHRLLLLHHLNT